MVRTNFCDAGVAVIALGSHAADISHASQNLYGLVRHVGGRLRGCQFRHRGFLGVIGTLAGEREEGGGNRCIFEMISFGQDLQMLPRP